MAVQHPLFARYVAQGPEAERFIRACLMTHHARGLAHTVLEVLARRRGPTTPAPRRQGLGVPRPLIVGDNDPPSLKSHGSLPTVSRKANPSVLLAAVHRPTL